jgi:transposase
VIQSSGLKPEEDAMAAPVPLRSDFDAPALRALARGLRDSSQTRRLLALSVISAGGSRLEAAAIGGVELQTVRDFRRGLQRGRPGRADRGQGPGARPRLNAEQRETLRALVEQEPTPTVHGVVRWRLCDLVQILCEGDAWKRIIA